MRALNFQLAADGIDKRRRSRDRPTGAASSRWIVVAVSAVAAAACALVWYL
jgi:4-hydroxybenzoate polyprenyltransferase